MLAGDWQNPVDAFDVDAADTGIVVSPLDALLVVNELNDRSVSDPITGALPEIGEDQLIDPPFFDVNADGYVSPHDALLVINELNADDFVDNGIQYTSVIAPSNVIAGSTAALSGGGPDLDTLVNTTTAQRQRDADVASDSRGNIVMVWQSFDQDGSSWGVYGQRYSPDGEKVGSEFLVNSTTQRAQRSPAVAANDDGFFVVWQSQNQDGSGWGVYGQEFGSNGNRRGSEMRINQTTRGGQLNPDVTTDDSGIFSVAWQGRGAGDRNGVFVRQINDGEFVTGESRVNNFTSGSQKRPTIDSRDGSYVVAWQGKGGNDNRGVFYSEMGSNQDVQVNVRTSGVQKLASIAHTDDGVAVSWQSNGDIYLREFNDSGISNVPVRVNQTDSGAQKGPVIAELADGNLIVSWFGKGNGDRKGVFSRMFADGSATSNEVQVNETSRAGQIRPAIVAVNDGYLAAWQGRGAGDRLGIFTRFFDTEITDPFEIVPVNDQTVDEGDTASVDVNIVDVDGIFDDVTFAIQSGSGATIDPTTGQFSFVTTEADGPGTFDFTVSATGNDAMGVEFVSVDTFQVTVNEVNLAPVLGEIGNQTAAIEMSFALSVSATDADLPAQELTFASNLSGGAALPAWLSFDANTQTFSGTPVGADAGTLSIEVTVTDSSGASDSETFSIDVSTPFEIVPVNNQTVDEGETASVDVDIVDVDGILDVVTFAIQSGSGATIDPTTGQFSFVTTEADGPGTFDFTVSATGNDAMGVEFVSVDTFQVTVNEVNLAPVLAEIGNQTVMTGMPFNLSVSATDADLPAQALTFASNLSGGAALPAWLSFDGNTQTFSGTPGAGDAGPLSVVVTVTDSFGASDSETFSIDIDVSGNQAPVVDVPISDETTTEDLVFSLDVNGVFSDPDGDALTLSTSALPSWLSFADGVFTGTPGAGDVQTTSITVTASDGLASVSDTFDLTVLDVNTPVVLDQVFRIDSMAGNGDNVGTVVASDPDPSDTLSYAIVGGNEDGIFGINASTGQLTVVDFLMLPATPRTEMTVQVSDGTFMGSANVTVVATTDELRASYGLEARDSGGNPITSVTSGQDFDLVLTVLDPSLEATGIFSAFADVLYPPQFVQIAGDVTFSTTYGAGTNAGLGTNGLIDEAGGVDGLSELGGGVFDVVTVPMRVGSVADGTTIFFATNETEQRIQHPTLVFGESTELPSSQIEFGTLSLTVGSSGSSETLLQVPNSGSSPTTNNASAADPAVQFSGSTAESNDIAPLTVAQKVTPFVNNRDTSIRDAAFGDSTEDESWWVGT